MGSLLGYGMPLRCSESLNSRKVKRKIKENPALYYPPTSLLNQDKYEERPTETYAGDQDHCRMMDDSPDDPRVAKNFWDSSDARSAHGDGPSRGA